jgi:flagellar protein FlbT
MNIWLRAGEKLYINGAVLRVDRKVSLELLNDATFLLEAHVMQAADATTPLRQLYFVVQLMLMDPRDLSAAKDLFRTSIEKLREALRRLPPLRQNLAIAMHRQRIGSRAGFRQH